MNELNSIEEELTATLSIRRFNWVDVAKRLIHIRENNIWRQNNAPSWTSWVKALSEKTERHSEPYFRMISAYSFYKELENNSTTLKPIEDTLLSKDTIMSIKMISRNCQDIGLKLMTDVVSGKYKRKHLNILNAHT
jgi:hypothetical protein